MLERIIDYLQRKNWTYTSGKVNGILFLPINGVNGIFNCVVDVTEDNSLFLFISFNGTTCPMDSRLRFAELLNRINFNLKFGNFEVGMESGEIKFRTSLFYEEMEINDKIIDSIILKNLHIHDSVFPYFNKFLFGSLSMDEIYNNIFPSTPIENKETKKIDTVNDRGE